MERLKTSIIKVDDDYLAGMSNKGTVKRAYKDLLQESPVLAWQGKEAQVTLKEACCVLRDPLLESSCSCPSRSICRHIITAILWMKKEMEQEGGQQGEGVSGSVKAGQEETEHKEQKPQILKELLEIPAERLKRACGSSHYRKFLAHMRANECPPIEESSIVTVTLPWEKATVKLLTPFVYSACTCHSNELCVHKAQAALIYQMEKGKMTLAELDALLKTEHSVDEALVKQVCATVCEEFCQQICMGLSRQSPETAESLERLAIMAHRAELPRLESGLRETAAYYRQYFSRSAAFQGKELLHKILVLYQMAQELIQAGSPETIHTLAGTFHDTYEPAGRLHLVGMGGRTFYSKSGYEGEIYYFLETSQKEWYTWTDARPVIYEGTRKKPPANSENALAPWGLNCSREQMQTLAFDLLNAKAAYGGRLSVSQESKAEITGTRNLGMKEIRQMIQGDYEKLLQSCFGRDHMGADAGSDGEQQKAGKDRNRERQERLTLVLAVRFGEASFDMVQQRFSWCIYDKKGRRLFISLKYTKEDKLTINLLERLVQRLQKSHVESIVCFGCLYMDEEGRMCLYPIEFFFEDAASEGGLLSEEESKEEGKTSLAAGKNSREQAQQRPPAELLKTMDQYFREAERQLFDLFASGIDSLQEETVSGLSIFAEDGERLGLHQAGEGFACIGRLLTQKHHQMEFSKEPVLKALGRLDAYFLACREKLSYDMAFLAMQEGT